MRIVVACLLLAACGGPRSPGPVEPPPTVDAATSPTGGVGSICAVGEANPDPASVTVVTCAEGLQCCYPCGIPGCDSVCMEDCGPPRP